MREETGLEIKDPGPLVWTREHVFDFQGTWYRQQDHFHFLRVAPFGVSTHLHDAEEQDYLLGHRWWALEDIERGTDEVFMPRRLAHFLKPLLQGEIPGAPIDVGV